jgi:autotransporter translocation and assembly factor TamB
MSWRKPYIWAPLLVVVLLGASLTLPWGGLLLRTVAWIASSPQVRIQLEGLGPGFPGIVRLDTLRLADASGVWMEAHRLEVRPHWAALLQGHIAIHDLKVGDLGLLRRPVQTAAHPTPSAMLPLRLDQVQVERLCLAEAVVGEEFQGRLEGNFHVEPAAVHLETTVEEEGGATRLHAQASWQATQNSLTLRMNLRAREHGVFQRLLRLGAVPFEGELTGNGTLQDWQGQFRLHCDDQLQATSSLAVHHGQLHINGKALLPGLPIDLDARITPQASGGIRVEELRLTHPQGHLAAAGQIHGRHGTWSTEIMAEAKDASILWSGTIQHNATELTLHGAATASLPEARTTAHTRGRLLWDGAWESVCELQLEHGKLPGSLVAQVLLRGRELAPKGEAELTITRLPQLPEEVHHLLGLQPRLTTLWHWQDGLYLEQLHLDAVLKATGTLALTSHGHQAALQLSLPPLAWAPHGGQGELMLHSADSSSATLTVHAPQILAGPMPIAQLKGELLWRRGQFFPFTGSLQLQAAATSHGVPLEVQARGQVSPQRIRLDTVRLQAASASLAGAGELALPLELSRLTARLQAPDLGPLSPLLGLSLQGQLQAGLEVSRQRGQLQIACNAAGRLSGEGLAATNVRISAQGPWQKMRGHLTVSDLRLGMMGLDSLHMEMEQSPDLLQAQVVARRGSDSLKGLVQARGKVPRHFRLAGLQGTVLGLGVHQASALELELENATLRWAPWTVSLGPTALNLDAGYWGPMVHARAQLRGSLAPLPALVGLPEHQLAGTGEVTASLTGPRDGARLEVQGRIMHLRYASPALGLVVDKGQGTISSGPDFQRIALDIQGQGATSGTVAAHLWWDVVRQEGQGEARFQDFVLWDTTRGRIQGNGWGKLMWNTSAPLLQGEVQIIQGQIRLPRRLGKTPRVEIQKDPPQTQEGPSIPPLALAVDVQTAHPVRITGHGVESLWDVHLNVQGTIPEPQMNGQMRLVEGSWRFLGQDFQLTRGEIHFPQGKTPVVDFTAQAQTPSIQTTAHILGPTDRLRVELSSVPPLPPEEILSRTLVGRSLRQVSPLQALRLAQGAASLAGRGLPGFDALEGLEQSLGLGGLELGTDAEGNPSVGIGRQWGSYYIRAERSLSGKDRTQVEVQITPHLGIKTEVGSDSRQGAGVGWSIDY